MLVCRSLVCRSLAYRPTVLAAAATVLALLAFPGSSSAAIGTSPKRYVALGDSYTAGPVIPVQRIDPIGCERSTNNYPALLARTLQIHDYTDVSCSGAKTVDMTATQTVPLGINPPQFDALRRDTDLVTLTIGGNDLGFTEIIFTCARVSATDPFGNPCQREAAAGGGDFYAQRIAETAPKVARVLDGIRARSPHATVLLVGYLRILPPAVGCFPVFPVARGDVPYLDGLEQKFNTMLADQAFSHGAAFVDSYGGSLGHDACKLPGTKWVEGTVPTSPAAPVHPNAIGMKEVADFARETLNNLNETEAVG